MILRVLKYYTSRFGLRYQCCAVCMERYKRCYYHCHRRSGSGFLCITQHPTVDYPRWIIWSSWIWKWRLLGCILSSVHIARTLWHWFHWFLGIKVDADWTYRASFYYKFPQASNFEGVINVGLQSSTGQVYASATVPVSGTQTTWKQASVYLNPTSSPRSTANNFTITVDGASAAGQMIDFAMLSLFPPTYKNRENGLRIDIASVSSRIECDIIHFQSSYIDIIRNEAVIF